MLRKTVLAICVLYLAGMLLLAYALVRAAPGPATQDLQGLAIGSQGSAGGVAYLSGRRLACANSAVPAPYTSRCLVEIAGGTLEIVARRNAPADPNQFGGSCAARYNRQYWPCRFSSRHVHVHWFAAIDDPLGLTPAQLGGLRRQYLIENLPESTVLRGAALAAVLSAVVAMAAAVALRPKAKLNLAGVWVPLASSAAAFAAVAVLGVFLTRGFWD